MKLYNHKYNYNIFVSHFSYIKELNHLYYGIEIRVRSLFYRITVLKRPMLPPRRVWILKSSASNANSWWEFTKRGGSSRPQFKKLRSLWRSQGEIFWRERKMVLENLELTWFLYVKGTDLIKIIFNYMYMIKIYFLLFLESIPPARTFRLWFWFLLVS